MNLNTNNAKNAMGGVLKKKFKHNKTKFMLLNKKTFLFLDIFQQYLFLKLRKPYVIIISNKTYLLRLISNYAYVFHSLPKIFKRYLQVS